jgi:hypothetical protein
VRVRAFSFTSGSWSASVGASPALGLERSTHWSGALAANAACAGQWFGETGCHPAFWAALASLAVLNARFHASTALCGGCFDTLLGALLLEESGRIDAVDDVSLPATAKSVLISVAPCKQTPLKPERTLPKGQRYGKNRKCRNYTEIAYLILYNESWLLGIVNPSADRR